MSPSPALRTSRNLIAIVSACLLGVGPIACSDGTGPSGEGGFALARVDAGYFHSCGITTEGETWCWGSNFLGLLGRDDVDDSAIPVRADLTARLADIDVGGSSTCGVTSDGATWCWGHNDEGQLGDGTFQDRERPFQLAGLPPLRSVSVGHAHACGLAADGEAWCWGDNFRGQLGRGVVGGKSGVPQAVSTPVRFRQLHAGYYATCGISLDDEPYCWGRNEDGQMGVGTQVSFGTPAAVEGGLKVRSIYPGDRVTCAVTLGGDTWCWGTHEDGLLGSHSFDVAVVPSKVEGMPKLDRARVALGASANVGSRRYACGVASDGETWCWGEGVPASGTPASAVPAGLTSIGTIEGNDLPATGGAHLCVIRDGSAQCAGSNFAGQLGDGSTEDRSVLTPVG